VGITDQRREDDRRSGRGDVCRRLPALGECARDFGQGVDADGKITLVIALIGLAVLAFGRGRRAGRIGQIVLGALTAIVGVADLRSIFAFGLYLTLIAGILWAVAAVAALRGSPATPRVS